MWAILALTGALLETFYYCGVKKFGRNTHYYILASGTYLLSGLILMVIAILKGFPTIGNNFYQSMFVAGVINSVTTILYYKALKYTDLSLAIPILSFSPLFLIFVSFFLLKELPTYSGIVGILSIIIGSYILNVDKKKNGLLDPVKKIFTNRGLRYMLIVSLLFAFGASFEKIIIKNSNILVSPASIYLFSGSIFTTLSLIKIKKPLKEYRGNISRIILLAIILCLAAVIISKALMLQIVPYVIALKRVGLIFSVLYGIFIFKEKNALKRILATLIMIIGSIIILLWGN